MKTVKLTTVELTKLLGFKDGFRKEKTFFVAKIKEHHIVFEHEINEDYIFVIMKNGDFTSGSGPMQLHKVFEKLENAYDYIMSNEGIYGSEQYCQNVTGVNVFGEFYCLTMFNGYDIKAMKLTK